MIRPTRFIVRFQDLAGASRLAALGALRNVRFRAAINFRSLRRPCENTARLERVIETDLQSAGAVHRVAVGSATGPDRRLGRVPAGQVSWSFPAWFNERLRAVRNIGSRKALQPHRSADGLQPKWAR